MTSNRALSSTHVEVTESGIGLGASDSLMKKSFVCIWSAGFHVFIMSSVEQNIEYEGILLAVNLSLIT